MTLLHVIKSAYVVLETDFICERPDDPLSQPSISLRNYILVYQAILNFRNSSDSVVPSRLICQSGRIDCSLHRDMHADKTIRFFLVRQALITTSHRFFPCPRRYTDLFYHVG
jgi:hypothetical protein